MKWMEKRAEFQKRFDELSQINVQGLIQDLNTAVGNYIAKSGLSQDPNNNPDYNNIQTLMKKAEDIKLRYLQLNDDILKYLSTQSGDNNLGKILADNGDLQKQINKLEKVIKEIQVDVDTAIERDKLLRSRDKDITRHQLFILDRPVRRGMIPYLWVVSILFIGIGLVIFRMTLPTIPLPSAAEGGTSFVSQLTEFFTGKIVLVSLLGSAIITILFLSLKIAGVFGK